MLGQFVRFPVSIEELKEFVEDSFSDCMVDYFSRVFLGKRQAKWIGSMMADNVALMIDEEAKLADDLVTRQIWTHLEVFFHEGLEWNYAVDNVNYVFDVCAKKGLF